MEPDAVASDLADLTEVHLGELAAAIGADDVTDLLARVDDPSSSISGYNPQRLD